ncbi:hypothetical protein KDH_38480 [Dictyobacter sp. S3.2.2.5]|uniref:FAD/NAD(P)-binding domain-containing protein n=1 Tax=Dictyobacter halimunensis TaxID=3026934 RepID=A0ABQ6FRY9_9CHLR|nr:hypothetical protein KDH_38480 [Dictyobacter sp. S3.2.2.5]
MSVSLNPKKNQASTPSTQYDVVVMGAGPYGLSLSAHLLGHGLKVATFGKVNYFWRNHMPDGMLLRSFWWASSLSDPQGKYAIARYYEAQGKTPADPMPRETFLDYVNWFQKHAVPNVDETYISNIEHVDDHYRVTLEDGRVVTSKAVAMAPGLHYYIYSPEEYAHMPKHLVSHQSEHATLEQFKGQRVAVIGGGQGSLETAALLNELGAKVSVFVRRTVRWLNLHNSIYPMWARHLRAPKAGMGYGWSNLFQEKYPYSLHGASRARRDNIVDNTHGPAGSHWLKPRIIGQVDLRENTSITKIEEVDGKVKLTLANGKEELYDHVILGTGYRPDVKGLPMLDENIKDALQTHRGSPVLNSHFETSVPGLYFVGFSSARSFGPFYRFVVGADAAARRASGAIAKQVVRSR